MRGYDQGFRLLLLILVSTIRVTTSQAYFYSWVKWDELNDSQRKAAFCLGYNKDVWNCNLFWNLITETWENLSESEKKCANVLGYDEIGRERSPIRPITMEWNELDRQQRKAAQCLQLSSQTWTTGVDILTKMDKIYWSELTSKRQQCATLLGFRECSWNDPKLVKLKRYKN